MDLGTSFKALVVDDEDSVRRMIVRGLIQQGFACDTASDGIEAESKVAQVEYDAVVTDLRMPNKHGHALSVFLLTVPNRPVIVVHTSVIEPKLAKDLLARGVDDILFKPFDFSILAAKTRALAERRRSSALKKQVIVPSTITVDTSQSQASDEFPVALDKLMSKLSGHSRILPISSAAFDVYSMTCANDYETPQIAAAILRDASLAADVLRLANCPLYNPSVQPIVELDRAVIRIGQKRIGEMALATNALATLTSSMVPWMDVGLAWKRSMAAGLAVEKMVERGRHQEHEEGLLLSAIMQSLGRVVLGMLYPDQYKRMTEQCRTSHTTLTELERRAFPISHAEVLSQVLGIWKIPDVVRIPLQHVMSDDAKLRELPKGFRLKAELLKVAIFAAECAVGRWEPWDSVELPPTCAMSRLGIDRIHDIIDQTRSDLALLTHFRKDAPATDERHAPPCIRELPYCNLSNGSYDFISSMMSRTGIKLNPCSEGDLCGIQEPVLLNCTETSPPPSLALRARRKSTRDILVVSDSNRVDALRKYGQVIALPTNFNRLHTSCWTASRPISTTSQQLGKALSLMA